jgi:hypothetical protein
MNPDNENLEKTLRASLRRTAAPPDFAAKVLARTRAPLPFPQSPAGPKTAKSWVRRPFTLAVAAALAGVAIIPAVVQEHQRREEARGLKAKRDLLTALAITRGQLQQAREKVRRTTRNIQ